MRWLLYSLLVPVSLTLSGCGFQLRGSVELPDTLQSIALEGTPSVGPLAVDVRNALNRVGGSVVESASLAESVIVVTRDDVTRNVLSVNSSGQANEYELNYQLGFRLESPAGDVLVPNQTVSLFRQYLFNPDTVLAKSDQEARLTREMRQSAVNQMLLRLSTSLKNAPAGTDPGNVNAPAS